MDSQIRDYYCQPSDTSPGGKFHQVIPLHENKGWTWEELKQKVPNLKRGWYELSQLNTQDRIEFTYEFWLSQLPFCPKMLSSIRNFFDRVEDVGIFLVQQKFDDPFEAHMVYGLKGGSGFFRGLTPASDDELLQLKRQFPDVVFPKDYLAFLQIHNGFSKNTDTGIFPTGEMRSAYEQFQNLLTSTDSLVKAGETTVDPQELIPFYESFGLPFFQCFWTAWYPEEEMGNVYYSSANNTISYLDPNVPSDENMSFASFSGWLLFYLEKID